MSGGFLKLLPFFSTTKVRRAEGGPKAGDSGGRRWACMAQNARQPLRDSPAVIESAVRGDWQTVGQRQGKEGFARTMLLLSENSNLLACRNTAKTFADQNNDVLDVTWFCDEARLYLSGYVNSQNMRIWVFANPHVTHKEFSIHRKLGCGVPKYLA
jgi:hypothetical protein